MIIESKKASFSIEEGLAQIIAYMLGSPNTEKPCFGMIATGSDFTVMNHARHKGHKGRKRR
ncbi:hypothetical protein NIES4071_12120 [Calothrix sp. NIES-4071]|nr:hypothetical protein NIES4071_12120 [Calothrix sp. NIES-4071]BAZ55552.1 hypothetical protein NIES4105_12080 [Calothrix sp. NIES-4105]